MNPRAVRLLVVTICGVMGYAAIGTAVGVSLGVPVYGLDVAVAADRLPIAIDAAFASMEDALRDLGVSEQEIAELAAGIDAALEDVGDVAEALPAGLPLPLIGGGVEIPLPGIVIDGVRLGGGVITDGWVRGIAARAGLVIPQPLFDAAIHTGEVVAAATVDAAFSSWMLSVDLVKRLDALIAALSFAGGIDVLAGWIEPAIELDLPPQMEPAAAAALAALHLDGLRWSTVAIHAAVGLELGPPFLRFGAELRFLLPVSKPRGWWGLGPAGLAAQLGITIRF